MALATYSDLLASVASWMNRTDLGSVIPDFVALAEGRIATDVRLRQQITTTALVADITTRAVELPMDYLGFTDIAIGGTPDTLCTFVSKEYLDQNYPEGGFSGRPFVFSIEGNTLYLGPTPDAAYAVNVSYYGRFDPLATTPTNGLLTYHPEVYLYAALREGAVFTMNDERATHWEALYTQAVKRLNDLDSDSTHAGSTLRVRTV